MRRALSFVLLLLLAASVPAGSGAAWAQKPPPLDAPGTATDPAPEPPVTRVPDLPGKPPALPPGAAGRGTPTARTPSTPRNTRPATPPAQGRPATPPADQPPAAISPPGGKPLPAPGPGEREA